ncbi:MAG: FUSC family protein, partial [Roseobacter sp.]
VPLLSMLSGGESLQAFQTVVLRAQETILGTLVFTVVSTFVFPSNTRGSFEKDIHLQLSDMHAALSAGRSVLLLGDPGKDQLQLPQEGLKQAALRQSGLLAKLEAAALDSFEIAETKRSWRRAIGALDGIVDTLERLRLGLPDLEGAKPSTHLAGLEGALDEILRRFRTSGDVLAGKELDALPHAVRLNFDRAKAEELPAFQRAALSQTHSKLRELDGHSEKLLVAIADVRGVAKDTERSKPAVQAQVLLPDPERIYGTLRVFTAFWLTFLAYIYLPDLPSWVVLIAMTTAVSMLMMMSPTLPLWGLAQPVVLSILFGGSVHILVMPHLSGFGTLGLTVFAATFLICWLCHRPQQAMGRALGLAFFAILTQIENTQTYSFTFVANLTVAFCLVLTILAIVSFFPVSFKPEHVFLRLIRRYFNAVITLLETVHVNKRERNSWLERQRRAYHARQMKIIPGRMGMWIKALPKDAITADRRKNLIELAAGLAMLGDRTRDLLATRDFAHSDIWVREVVGEARAWRHAIQDICAKLGAAAPEHITVDDLHERLSRRMNTLERLVADAIAAGRTEEVGGLENEILFRELGGFRGVSSSLISLVELAKQIDWPRLREARL